MTTSDSLLQPYQLKHLTLKNRVMSTSHEPAYFRRRYGSEDHFEFDLVAQPNLRTESHQARRSDLRVAHAAGLQPDTARSLEPRLRLAAQNILAVAMQSTVMTSSPPAMRSPLVIFARNWVSVAESVPASRLLAEPTSAP
ncbi:hypothetical protein SAMN05428953_14213 [Mesorhizobium muleiense]|uniref:Uncharacterized protein n=1 Tax=Mesorhizobium muleiense TaxID=1004279 RepID=A0A1G9KRX3_9HYPH|nr:hypothetical protein SAMN05428953_14213 [Mesorhizobium muleiense]